MGHIQSLPVFINKALLEATMPICSHVWLLLHENSRTEWFTVWLKSLKHLPFDPLQKRLPTPDDSATKEGLNSAFFPGGLVVKTVLLLHWGVGLILD